MRIFLAAILVLSAHAADFGRDIQPILQRRCYTCHGPAMQMGKLRLDVPANAIAANRRILELTAAKKMPPTGPLPAAEIALLQSWTERPWSFQPLRPQPKSTIDQFVLAELSKQKLSPSPEADKRTLARRLYLDLTGLPQIGRAVQQECRDRSRMPSSA
eukprot:TRINITY_DN78032_c0_g1_i1.p2 TRINITY_DN78032_c0_g1~~TRINITY_DN78032_c0_g1_i1.p2  ORF type:complete len:159 (-),score=28.83 TRINITY_DN78032_c0_g1_i1:10-486(-)